MNTQEIERLLGEIDDVAHSFATVDQAEQPARFVLATLQEIPNSDISDADRYRYSAEAWRILAIVARTKGEVQKAREYNLDSLALSKKSHNQRCIASMATELGITYRALADYDKAIESYLFALDLYSTDQDPIGLSNCYGNLSNTYWAKSEFLSALEYGEKALQISESLENTVHKARHLNSLGNACHGLGDYPRALDYFMKSLEAYKKIDNRNGIALSAGNIGSMHLELGDFPAALRYVQQALDIDAEMGNRLGVARHYSNVAGIYYEMDELDQAITYFNMALAMDEELGNKPGMARSIGNLGAVYFKMNDFEQASQNIARALSIDEELGNMSAVASWKGNLGRIYLETKTEHRDLVQAENYLLKAATINEELAISHGLYMDYRSLAHLYEELKQWEQCATYYKKYHEVYLKLQSDEAAARTRALENRRRVEEAERDRQVKLARFQEQEKILHNILPTQIAERIVAGEKSIADSYDNISVFFSDIVEFTKLSQNISAEALVVVLNELFTHLDHIARVHGLEKIKTIGDAYMAVCGVPREHADHAERTARFAIDVQNLMSNYTTKSGYRIQLRMGLHCGSAVAGVIGEDKYAYDVWGDAVNIASRMESHGETGRIHCSHDFATSIQNSSDEFTFEDRGHIDIKGKGLMRTYFLVPRTIMG